jgi:hypothetical protein
LLQEYRYFILKNVIVERLSSQTRKKNPMLKRWLTSSGLLMLLLLLAPTMPALATVRTQTIPAKSYSADRFDEQIAVQSDGTLLVRETIVFKFIGGPFTFVYRDIPIPVR